MTWGRRSHRLWKHKCCLHLDNDSGPVGLTFRSKPRSEKFDGLSEDSPSAQVLSLQIFLLGDANLQSVGPLSVHAKIGLVFQNAFLPKYWKQDLLGKGRGEAQGSWAWECHLPRLGVSTEAGPPGFGGSLCTLKLGSHAVAFSDAGPMNWWVNGPECGLGRKVFPWAGTRPSS